MRKKLSFLLIAAGILLILIPIAGNIYMKYQQHQLEAAYEAQQAADIMDPQFADEPVSGSSITAGALSDGQGAKPALPENMIGRIKIPAISCDLLVLEGSSSKELKYGAGHVTTTAMPGQPGNCAIAGHRNYTFGTYFTRLGEIKNDDQVIVEYQGTEYTYVVNDIFVVDPTDVSVLNQPKNESLLTLITCTPKGSNTHRLIVRAALVK